VKLDKPLHSPQVATFIAKRWPDGEVIPAFWVGRGCSRATRRPLDDGAGPYGVPPRSLGVGEWLGAAFVQRSSTAKGELLRDGCTLECTHSDLRASVGRGWCDRQGRERLGPRQEVACELLQGLRGLDQVADRLRSVPERFGDADPQHEARPRQGVGERD
jgi:hypothetical protein